MTSPDISISVPGEPVEPACPFSGAQPNSISRRAIFGGAIALAATSLLTGGATRAAALTTSTSLDLPSLPRDLPGLPRWSHAVGDPRGSEIVALFGRNSEARFGTMFPQLEAYSPADALLTGLAQAMVEPRGPLNDIRPDGLDNFDVPSGFIYLGQFIDHDMTMDTTPLTLKREDPHATTNFDTPLFDLGSVYGQGPAGSPELYESDGKHLKLALNALGCRDLPRDPNQKAFIGDPRNDENLIINQMQQAFILLHNRFLDNEAAGSFAIAQRLTQWHFQWVIVHDFLPHIVGQSLLDSMLFTSNGKIRANTVFYRPRNPHRPMMPIEFSAGAYRWGHSAIRPEYEMHETSLSPSPAVLPIFDGGQSADVARDLRGFRPLYTDALIDWNYFFEIPGVNSPDDRNFARLIDTEVARPLCLLPDSVVAHTPGAILALSERNLLRGKRLGLPAGQDVAALMKKTLTTMPAPLTNTQLDPFNEFGLNAAGWSGKAPLWFYCLQEASRTTGGHKLGAVGSRIVAEVLLGILQLDANSYFNASEPFTPIGGYNFKMGDLLKLAGAPIVDPQAPLVSPQGPFLGA